MILEALNDYYERKVAHQADRPGTDASIAPEGFESKEIPFVIVLDESGALVQIDDTRSGDGRKMRSRVFLVPQGTKKSVNVAANLLWGNAEYVLGIPDPKKLDDNRSNGTEARYRDRLDEMHRAFVDLIGTRLAQAAADAGIVAVLAFLRDTDFERLSKEPSWQEIATRNPNLTFRLAGDGSNVPVCARPAVVETLRQVDAVTECDTDVPNAGLCLVRGEADRIERLHPAIKGVWGAQTSGANIVSFNLDAFNSYGKEQSYNAPVGEHAAFAYTTALNHLLRKGSSQRLQVGDASTVFWATDKSHFEDDFAAMFGAGGSDGDDPDRETQAVRRLLETTKTGVYLDDDKDTRFCVLGLAPNAARIAVRFWQIGAVKDFALNIAQHFKDIEIVKPAYESGYLPLWRLLGSIALQGKTENIPPDLAGDTMRAILAGLPYPPMLLQAAVRRCRAEQEIGHPRAAIVKASINRLIRSQQFHARELDMSLDKSNTDPGYRLGRLFAALERIQAAAQPGINATIRDRYYGAASSSPASVFPVLLRLKNHHLSKIDRPALAVWYEKLLGQIVDGIADFPPQLNLREQGLFAIGYYHQQQDFFKGSKEESGPTSSNGKGEQ
jgi:CRISPR-associated protein Csd1